MGYQFVENSVDGIDQFFPSGGFGIEYYFHGEGRSRPFFSRGAYLDTIGATQFFPDLFGEEDVEQLVEGIQLDQVRQGVGQFAAVNDADGGFGGFQRTGEAVFDAPFLHDHALLVDGGLGLFTGQRGNILFHQGFEAVEVDVADKGEGKGGRVGETSLVE
ncbi:MAG: hypothetical protein BWY72_02569 [Bacteroidetes bacterium ADurb.Bin416]|nr:MAG: hypothetical protein BWY72_02569 [Bacteroidetes bacterium ADurb.Bin416]